MKDGTTPRGDSHLERKGNAAVSKENCAVLDIVNCVLNDNLNEEQQVRALFKAAQHKDVRRIFKSAQLINVKEYSLFKYIINQKRKMIQVVRQIRTKEGRAKDDICMFVESAIP